MGYRTVVVLANDDQHNWEQDAELGAKIARAAAQHGRDDSPCFGYGTIVEVEHADRQTLVVLDSYNGKAIAEKHWTPREDQFEIELSLLKQAAARLGYRLEPI